jgi:cytochrome oxidase Cu insertion factor (SCO1/SenC/PrrC family)
MKLKSAAALVVAVIALSACGADSSSSDAEVVATTASAQSTEPQSGSNVDGFVAKTVSGETFVLSDALAQKPVVLWFWAPG